jgi:hypothetical protein
LQLIQLFERNAFAYWSVHHASSKPNAERQGRCS